MSEDELTKACRAIYDAACADIRHLVESSGYKVFCDEWAFHAYVKHNDSEGQIVDGNELMERITSERQRKSDDLVYASQANIEAERKRILNDEIKRAEEQIKYGKDLIIGAEEKLMQLRQGEFPNDK